MLRQTRQPICTLICEMTQKTENMHTEDHATLCTHRIMRDRHPSTECTDSLECHHYLAFRLRSVTIVSLFQGRRSTSERCRTTLIH